jgi:beta-lactamase regulating signal transducer with metallopeptidase domain
MMRMLETASDVLSTIAVNGSTVLVIGAAVALMARRASAALKHMLWTATLAAACVLPIVGTTLPAIRLPILPAPQLQPSPYPTIPSTSPPRAATARASSRAPDRAARVPRTSLSSSANPAAAAPVRDGIPVIGLLAFVWLAGIALLGTRLIVGQIGLSRLARLAHGCDDACVLARVAEVRSLLRVRRRLHVLMSADTIPVTWGVVRPIVLLPSSVTSWDAERLDAVLIHEIGHIARFDVITQGIAWLAATLFWFQPVVWFAKRRAQLERERACDDLVLARGMRPSRYAEELIAIIQSLDPATHPSLAGLSMVRVSELEGRVVAILDPRRRRHGVTRVRLALAGGFWAALLPIAAVRAHPARASGGQHANGFITFTGTPDRRVSQVGDAWGKRATPDTMAGSNARDGAARIPDTRGLVGAASNTAIIPEMPESVTFRQIVIAPQPSAGAKDVAHVSAESLLSQLKAGSDFATLAQRASSDLLTARTGGDLGWVQRDQIPQELSRWLFGNAVQAPLPAGGLSPVVETPQGFHIIRVDRVIPGRVHAHQIVIPPVRDSNDVARAHRLADSVAVLLKTGATFDSLARRYHDYVGNEVTSIVAWPFDSLPIPYQQALQFGKAGDVVVFRNFGSTRSLTVPKFVVVQLVAVKAPAVRHPDFSGTWTLDVAKSEANQLPTSETRRVTQTDKAMSIAHTITAMGRTSTVTEHFMLDGSPSTNTWNTTTDFKTTAAWHENVLVMTTTWDQALDAYSRNSYSRTQRYSLSDDKTTLTIASEMLIEGRPYSDKLVFLKQ